MQKETKCTKFKKWIFSLFHLWFLWNSPHVLRILSSLQQQRMTNAADRSTLSASAQFFNICSLLCMTMHVWSRIPRADRPSEIKRSLGSGHRSARLCAPGRTLSVLWVERSKLKEGNDGSNVCLFQFCQHGKCRALQFKLIVTPEAGQSRCKNGLGRWVRSPGSDLPNNFYKYLCDVFYFFFFHNRVTVLKGLLLCAYYIKLK